MNQLQHIRSMAEMILKQVDELENKPKAKPKFKVGDRVIKTTGTSDVLVIEEIEPYPDGTGWNCILNAGCQNEDHLTLYINDEQANEVWFGPTAEERIWHKGPPPHVGWWNASVGKAEHAWRWWNGECWSVSATQHESADSAAYWAECPELNLGPNEQIQWTYYWPENARVPRVDPGV